MVVGQASPLVPPRDTQAVPCLHLRYQKFAFCSIVAGCVIAGSVTAGSLTAKPLNDMLGLLPGWAGSTVGGR